MVVESIATSRANLSTLLKQVNNGETIVVLDRGLPVARLEPVTAWDAAGYALMAKSLTKAGDLLPRRQALADDFFDMPLSADAKAGVRSALIDERRDGR